MLLQPLARSVSTQTLAFFSEVETVVQYVLYFNTSPVLLLETNVTEAAGSSICA